MISTLTIISCIISLLIEQATHYYGLRIRHGIYNFFLVFSAAMSVIIVKWFGSKNTIIMSTLAAIFGMALTGYATAAWHIIITYSVITCKLILTASNIIPFLRIFLAIMVGENDIAYM